MNQLNNKINYPENNKTDIESILKNHKELIFLILILHKLILQTQKRFKSE